MHLQTTPKLQRLSEDPRATCVVEGCARRPYTFRVNHAVSGMCSVCFHVKNVKAKCVEDGCEQLQRHASGRCRLCECVAAVSGLPQCIEEGCLRRPVARGDEPPPKRCWTCAMAMAARR